MPKKAEPVRIWPVPGRFILGVPAIEQELPADEAAALVETGAFAYEPEPAEQAAEAEEN